MENPIKMDDLGVPPFKETSIWTKIGRDFIHVIHVSEVVNQHHRTGTTPQATLNLYQQAAIGRLSGRNLLIIVVRFSGGVAP